MAKKKNSKSKNYNKESVLKVLNSFRIDKGVESNLEPLSDIKKQNKKSIPLPKFVKVSTKTKTNKFPEIGKRVEKGELKWSHYAIENNNGYHYYEILK